MQALRSEILPPSGVEFAVSLKLLPYTVCRTRREYVDSSDQSAVCNLVVARTNIIKIYEIIEEPLPQIRSREDGRETEAVEGEVEMDSHGDGFVNMGMVKSTNSTRMPSKTPRLHFVREHRLHGIVTGLESVKVLSSIDDNLDRLVISFKDAKIALMEWSSAIHDISTVSIHTYERAPQIALSDPSKFVGQLRADPASRCVALSLPQDALAILPLYQSQIDLDLMDVDHSVGRDIPYLPSFVLDLANQVDHRIRHAIDYTFLPGFDSPTLAVLCQPRQTWTGRLQEFKDTCHVFILTLDIVTHKFPILASAESLPHDCFSIQACTSDMGGVLVLSGNAIIYIDQSGRKLTLPVNGWASRVSDMHMQALSKEEQQRDLHLEGSFVVGLDSQTFLLITSDGLVYPLNIIREARTATRLLLGPAMSQTTVPCVSMKICADASTDSSRADTFFIGSINGPSVLLRATRVEETIRSPDADDQGLPSVVADNPMSLDLDDDDDIYGDITATSHKIVDPVERGQAAERRMATRLSLCETLPGYGSINDMTFALSKIGDRPSAELLTVTGYEKQGGFSAFQKDIPALLKRKVHAIGGARGIWSLSMKQGSANDTVIISTDASPSPGLTRFASKTSRNDVTITSRRTETTIGAAPFFQRTAILHITTDLIRVLNPDTTERQCIKDMDGSPKRAKIRYCCISDPFILVLREDDTLGLFVGDAEKGRIRRKDMTPMGEKSSHYSNACFFSDKSGLFQTRMHPSTTADASSGDAQKSGTTSLEATVDSSRGTQWLILCRPQNIIEIWTLPKLALVFSTSTISDMPFIMTDSFEGPALSVPQEPPRRAHEFDIDLMLLSQLGESWAQPFLTVMLRCGQLAIYQAVLTDKPSWPQSPSRSSIGIQFVKILSRTFEARNTEIVEKVSIIAEQRRALRSLIPFTTTQPSSRERQEVILNGVFVTGDEPTWIVATDRTGLKAHSCGWQSVNSITPCSLWDSKSDFLMHTDEGPCLVEWAPDVELGTEMPLRSKTFGRSYTKITFNASAGLLVASFLLKNKLNVYDEEENQLWTPDASNIEFPKSEMSAIELITSDVSAVLDGFEFQHNEVVTALECISLETQSTETGSKEFIVVGTTINRGEDLAVKGATYVFDIAETVPDPEDPPGLNFKLRFICRDEAKGPVTALCGINGYLVSSMGQKILVRALELDERLVGVAFLDVGVYVTTLRSIKNFLLVGDAVKSVWFVAFQEDPFKLVIVAKDVQQLHVSTADFLFDADGMFYIVACDTDGIVRLLDYDPEDHESKSGQYLLRRTEFHTQVESQASALIARRIEEGEGVPQARLISGLVDGSMYTLTPLHSDESAKRLQLLQGLLVRNVQHIAGLNPRAFRIVRNDTVTKALNKGILDGNLLSSFLSLPIHRQKELTDPIGTDRAQVLRDLECLSAPW